jgi:hypothetical protein
MDDDLLDLERALWLDGAERFRVLMAEGAIMVFPEPVGILRGDAILAGLEGVPRWSGLVLTGLARVGHGATTILAYRAEARRGAAPPYLALCSSTWVRSGRDWRILCHQQTPA